MRRCVAAAGVVAAIPQDRVRLWPEQGSQWASHVDAMFVAMTAFAAVLALAIATAIVWFAVRYRRGSNAPRGVPGPNSWRAELVWIGLPTLIAMGMFWWGATGFVAMHRPPPDAYTVYVMGKQWMWKVLHPSGRQEIDALHLPQGRAVRVLLVSQDVVHSFYVPAFRVKQDALPDRYTSVWFTPTRPGRFDLFCAEYCGLGHSHMTGIVTVLPPQEFARWLDPASDRSPVDGVPGQPRAPLALAGDGPFHRFGCNACHVPTAAVRAPRLDGLYGREVRLKNGQLRIADEQYLRESILRPNAAIVAGYPEPSLMPSYQGQIDEAELAQLIEFIKSIRYGWEAPR